MCADDFHDLGHGVFEWSAYDPAVKVDLHAHALTLDGEPGLVCVDPIPLERQAREELFAVAGVDGVGLVLLTNGNHARAAAEFRRRFRVPVWAHAEARETLGADGLGDLGDGAVPRGMEMLALPGFGPGEVAYFHPDNGGTLFVGDALINLPAPHGFSVLPDKYCADPRLGRHSLRALLDLEFTRLLFAHGHPMTTGARRNLEALLSTAAKP